ncbi:MAG: ASCH domain-containing protein [Henriciella sp.]|uniref:ASCH domain-containing protein n=1 Tax=Henriciella sp. TaxID=1968823 RepID=UPI003C79109D
MQFAARLRDQIRRGEITTTIRIWQSPRVKAGGAYRLAPGHVVVDHIREISIADITPQMARESGFSGTIDLLKTARHGAGTRVFFIRFHYEES